MLELQSCKLALPTPLTIIDAAQIVRPWRDAIVRMSDQLGVGCVLVEQHVDVVLDFSTNVIVLERGVAAYSGSATALREEEDLLNRTIGIQKC